MNRLARTFSLLALCAAARFAVADAASPYGVCSHITRAGYGYRDESCAHIAGTGIGAVRSDVDWYRCQPAPDAPFDFSFYDAALASCEARGLRFLPILMRPPAWAKPIGEHLEEWGAFVEAFVRRYGMRCPDIEIMNETNLRVFWGSDPDPETYAAVLRTAFAAARRAEPGVRVLLGGLNGVPLPYLRRVLECAGPDSFDAVCIHPYTHPYPPEPALEQDLASLRALLAEFGAAGKPVIVSELGWPTHQANVEGLPLLRMLLAAARPEQKAWRCVYATTAPESGASTVASAIAAVLPSGSTCEELFGDALRARLATGGVDAVIYPFDETFPADTFDAVFAFVRDGGVLVDIGGMPMWYPCTETAPGVFSKKLRGEDAAPLRDRFRLSLDAWWLNPALPREARAFPTPAASAAGYKGDPAGERARRFFKPDRLGPEDEFVPLLVMKDTAGGEAVAASLIRYGGDMKGCLAVSGVMGRNASVPIDEAAQARYLVRSLAICLALGVDGYYWYEFRSPEEDPNYSEHHFGLTHKDFAPKPALEAYRAFIARRPPGSVQRDIPLRDPDTGLYRSEWKRPDGTVGGVLWKPGEIEDPVFY